MASQTLTDLIKALTETTPDEPIYELVKMKLEELGNLAGAWPPGSLVRLKTLYALDMVVQGVVWCEHTNCAELDCVWFNHDGELQMNSFRPEIVRPLAPEETKEEDVG